MINTDYLHKNNKIKFQKYLSKNHFRKEQLNVKSYPNARVLPYKYEDGTFKGGVVDSSGCFVKESRFNCQHGASYRTSQKDMAFVHRPAVFIAGLVFPAWGHLLTDDLKHLWWFLSDDFKRIQKCKNTLFVVIKSMRIANINNHRFIFSCLGIETDRICVLETPTVFDEVLLPLPCIIPTDDGERIWTKEYKETIRTITHNIIANIKKTYPIYSKIYFSRTKIINHRDFGEKNVEQIFENAGFKVLYPEELSIAEQVWYIYNCKIFASTEGSIAHNAVFLQPGSCAYIVRKANYINPYQIVIDEMNSIETVYIDAHLSFLNNKKVPMIGPFFIYVSEAMARLLHTRKKFPIYEFLRYVRWSLFHRDFFQRIYSKGDYPF